MMTVGPLGEGVLVGHVDEVGSTWESHGTRRRKRRRWAVRTEWFENGLVGSLDSVRTGCRDVDFVGAQEEERRMRE